MRPLPSIGGELLVPLLVAIVGEHAKSDRRVDVVAAAATERDHAWRLQASGSGGQRRGAALVWIAARRAGVASRTRATLCIDVTMRDAFGDCGSCAAPSGSGRWTVGRPPIG
jgi:hypothetical protein